MRPVNEEKLNAFVMRGLGDLGAAFHVGMVVLGERLGLYKAMAGGAPMTAADLAAKTGTHERYVREWLASQAASGYVDYDAATNRYSISAEQEFALTNPDGPVYLPGGFLIANGALKADDRLVHAFRTGEGVGWHEHHPDLFHGTELFFRPGYAAHLISSWIPALEGVEEKLRRGARVADVGCGHGSSTILMAQAFPASTFIGFDYHAPSIESARRRAADAGVADRVRFETASSREFPGSGYDLVTFFDCLHDMGDPAGAAAHVLQTLDADGTWMIVEPFAGDHVADNLNPIGRVFYGASTMICTPASLSQDGRRGLGAQAGESALREVVTSGGFRRFRRAAETPFNLILEARP